MMEQKELCIRCGKPILYDIYTANKGMLFILIIDVIINTVEK